MGTVARAKPRVERDTASRAAVKPFDESLFRELQDPAFAVAFLEAALEDGMEEFLRGLRKYVQATGGVTHCAERTGLAREAIYRMLSGDGNPEFRSLLAILEAYGLRFGVRQGSSVTESRLAVAA